MIMKAVTCLDDGNRFFFEASSGLEAMHKMLYTLNLVHKDERAILDLCNNRTWCLTHNGKTYSCLI